MSNDSINLSALSVQDLVKEVETGLSVLISAAKVVERFGVFLPSNVKATLDEAVKILTAVQSIVSKV